MTQRSNREMQIVALVAGRSFMVVHRFTRLSLPTAPPLHTGQYFSINLMRYLAHNLG